MLRNVCSILIEMGAEPSFYDSYSWTPLAFAVKNGFPSIVALLLENNAFIDTCDKNLETPLHYACCNGHVNCINLLLDNGASIQSNIYRQNLLDLALENNQKEACMGLLKHSR